MDGVTPVEKLNRVDITLFFNSLCHDQTLHKSEAPQTHSVYIIKPFQQNDLRVAIRGCPADTKSGNQDARNSLKASGATAKESGGRKNRTAKTSIFQWLRTVRNPLNAILKISAELLENKSNSQR
jgi:hypothetical protein